MTTKSMTLQSTTGRVLPVNWPLRAPFPWFGGKSRVAGAVWRFFGKPDNYLEPFAGSLAVLLARPVVSGAETVNDKDGYIANFWRSLRAEPITVARLVAGPALEPDLWARRKVLVEQREEFTAKLCADPDFYDPVIAAWWVWTINASIAPQVKDEASKPGTARGIFSGTYSVLDILRWFEWLSSRLENVRVLCGDWSRTVSPGELNSTRRGGVAAVFLDPPYAQAEGKSAVYTVEEQNTATRVREWAIEHGQRPGLRIALCGHEGEHDMPAGWFAYRWQRQGGFANQNQAPAEGTGRETIWFSPHCEGL